MSSSFAPHVTATSSILARATHSHVAVTSRIAVTRGLALHTTKDALHRDVYIIIKIDMDIVPRAAISMCYVLTVANRSARSGMFGITCQLSLAGSNRHPVSVTVLPRKPPAYARTKRRRSTGVTHQREPVRLQPQHALAIRCPQKGKKGSGVPHTKEHARAGVAMQ